jgi:hypothetical protein
VPTVVYFLMTTMVQAPGCWTMNKTTIFTFGYYRWSNATPQLVEAVDAVEASRGFEPPIFVDIRFQRNDRNQGFEGNAFEKVLGLASRHRWMKSLGNKFIQQWNGPEILIADPSAANDLLDLALEAGGRKQRVIFFCGCEWPRCNGEIACHRSTVAELVLQAAQRRGESVKKVEWPGGKPKQINLNVTPRIFASVRKGRMTVPLGETTDLVRLAGLPWGSIATLYSAGHGLHRIVGPASWQADGWCLPVLSTKADGLAECEKEAATLSESLGLEPVTALWRWKRSGAWHPRRATAALTG